MERVLEILPQLPPIWTTMDEVAGVKLQENGNQAEGSIRDASVTCMGGGAAIS